MNDYILHGGMVVDGTGARSFRADVALNDGRITAIGDLEGVEAVNRIDVTGLVVSPGFIDAHSHSDIALLRQPTADNKVLQGITTEVIGNCGSSAVPITEKSSEQLLKTLSDVELDGLQWNNFDEYVELLEETGTSLNVIVLAGHGTLRAGAVGYDARQATQEELEQMKALLAEAMKQGAFGLSSGLIYPPGSYAPTEELEELAVVVGEFDGLYATHLRSEADTLEEAVEEALQIGAAGQTRVLVSHHKVAGERNWGKVRNTLERMRTARSEGQNVACDVYPYLAGSTSLAAVMPPWAHEGGTEELLQRLQDPETRARIREEFETGLPEWENLAGLAGWENIMITNAKSEGNRELPGMTIAELAEQREEHPAEVAMDVVVEEEGSVGMVLFVMDEEDMQRVLRDPWTMIGSDASVCVEPESSASKPHPRAYGTFPRVLGKYVRQEKVLELEEAVRKMTSLPAGFFKLPSRGRIAPGYVADITVFSPATIIDRATYIEPNQYPGGISHVFVAGTPVVLDGEHTKKKPGRVLRS